MYAKLFTSIYQGTLRGDSHGLLVFTNLLAHADVDGSVDIHPRAISEEVGLTVDQVKASLLVLEAPDPESRSPEADGRRLIRMDEHRAWGWHIVNHAKYNAIRSIEDRREQNRRAQARWRSKQEALANDAVSERKPLSPESAHIDTDIDTNKEKTKTARKRAAPAVLVSVDDMVADGVEQQHATDWLVSRKAKGLPLTPTAWADTKAEAIKAGISTRDAIKTAAGNGWAGFKASWLHQPPRNGGYQSAKATENGKWIKGTSLDTDFIEHGENDGAKFAIR